MHVKVPGIKQEVGAGELVKAALDKVGKHQKQGCGCKKIQAVMDRVRLVPRTSPDGVIGDQAKPTQ